MTDTNRPTPSRRNGDFDPSACLCDADAEALDALTACGFDVLQVPAPLRDRATHVARVLGLLDHDNGVGASGGVVASSQGSDVLIDVTLARVSRVRAQDAVEPVLCDDDHDALELLVSGGYAPERVPGGVRSRAKQHMAILSLLDSMEVSSATMPGVDGREALVASTLSRVQANIATQERRMALDTKPRVARRSLGDLISVAAMLLIAGAVVAPVASAVREYGRRTECQANLMAAGLGFGAYAKDFREMLPLASESRAGTPWWHVGDAARSNSANLFTLARTSYAKLSDLACAGNPDACSTPASAGPMDWRTINQVSYSYQNMFATDRTRWTQPSSVVIIADRSPIIPLAMQGRVFDPMANSLNHGGRGQGVLFNDGSARFLRTPVLEKKDNIYLPRVLEEAIARQNEPNKAKPLHGTESPDSADDSFVGP